METKCVEDAELVAAAPESRGSCSTWTQNINKMIPGEILTLQINRRLMSAEKPRKKGGFWGYFSRRNRNTVPDSTFVGMHHHRPRSALSVHGGARGCRGRRARRWPSTLFVNTEWNLSEFKSRTGNRWNKMALINIDAVLVIRLHISDSQRHAEGTAIGQQPPAIAVRACMRVCVSVQTKGNKKLDFCHCVC